MERGGEYLDRDQRTLPKIIPSPNIKSSTSQQRQPMREALVICYPTMGWENVHFSILPPLKIQGAVWIMEVLYQGSYLLYIIKYLKRMDRKDQQTELSDPWCGHYLVTIICCPLLCSVFTVHTLIRVRDGPAVRADTTDTYQEKRRDLQIIHFHISPEKENIFRMV